MSKHEHAHTCVCEHDFVRYCKHCHTVYCLNCNKEWSEYTYIHYQPWYPNTTWTSTGLVYNNNSNSNTLDPQLTTTACDHHS